MNIAQKLGLYRHIYTMIGTILTTLSIKGLPEWVPQLFSDQAVEAIFTGVIGSVLIIVGIVQSNKAPEKQITDQEFKALRGK